MNAQYGKRVWMLMGLVVAMAASAEETPLKMTSDARISVVAYQPYNVVPIVGAPFTTTQITFDSAEIIEDIENGDLGAWTASINKKLPYMLFLKPTAYGSETNMTVVTNERTYYFHLASTAEHEAIDQKNLTYAIHFIYPFEQQKKVEAAIATRQLQQQAELSAAQNPGSYHWEYSFHGDKRIVPLHVFDDGKFTYFELQPNQAIPAVFAVYNRDGQETVINFRKDERGDHVYLVIELVAPQFTLRNGPDEVASIFNDRMIRQMQGSGGQS